MTNTVLVLYAIGPCADLNRMNHAVVKTTLHDEIWGIKFVMGSASRVNIMEEMKSESLTLCSTRLSACVRCLCRFFYLV
jgi:hypothetical protein